MVLHVVGCEVLDETARHLYASSPDAVYLNGFLPSQVDVPLGDRCVRLTTEARIPDSGDVRILVEPQKPSEFSVRIRVPGWARLRAVEVNGQSPGLDTEQGYVSLRREWRAGDRVDVHFELPLARFALDRGHGPTQLAEGNVQVDAAAP